MAKLFDGKNIDLSAIGNVFTLNANGEVFIGNKYLMTLPSSCEEKTSRIVCKKEVDSYEDESIPYDPFSDFGGYVIE